MTGKEKSRGSTQQHFVRIDLTFPPFKKEMSQLGLGDISDVLDTITKIQNMTWQQIWDSSSKTPGGKRGINWEPIDQETSDGKQIASIRITRSHRARVCRDGDWMRFISLHPDHDSAYHKR